MADLSKATPEQRENFRRWKEASKGVHRGQERTIALGPHPGRVAWWKVQDLFVGSSLLTPDERDDLAVAALSGTGAMVPARVVAPFARRLAARVRGVTPPAEPPSWIARDFGAPVLLAALRPDDPARIRDADAALAELRDALVAVHAIPTAPILAIRNDDAPRRIAVARRALRHRIDEIAGAMHPDPDVAHALAIVASATATPPIVAWHRPPSASALRLGRGLVLTILDRVEGT